MFFDQVEVGGKQTFTGDFEDIIQKVANLSHNSIQVQRYGCLNVAMEIGEERED